MYPLLDQSILTKPSLPQSVFLKCMKPTSIHTPHTPLVQLSVVSHSHKLYFFVFPSLSLSLSLSFSLSHSVTHTHTHTHFCSCQLCTLHLYSSCVPLHYADSSIHSIPQKHTHIYTHIYTLMSDIIVLNQRINQFKPGVHLIQFSHVR